MLKAADFKHICDTASSFFILLVCLHCKIFSTRLNYALGTPEDTLRASSHGWPQLDQSRVSGSPGEGLVCSHAYFWHSCKLWLPTRGVEATCAARHCGPDEIQRTTGGEARWNSQGWIIRLKREMGQIAMLRRAELKTWVCHACAFKYEQVCGCVCVGWEGVRGV